MKNSLILLDTSRSEASLIQIFLKFFLVTVTDRDIYFTENNPVAVYYLYFILVHDERTVYPHEMIGRKQFLHGFQAHQAQDGLWLVFCIYLEVIF